MQYEVGQLIHDKIFIYTSNDIIIILDHNIATFPVEIYIFILL
jgi:hypothetical protein